ncbi:hypothetical protein CRG98_036912 [Punica granatum]|uniref:Uncharacterized protein n=1 Tax=Punica granatum TaxID=22663 RepID=A0A2I0IG06_PUNGR|nr:hypothetical protein CRG98_036912 [Punica granatum]
MDCRNNNILLRRNLHGSYLLSPPSTEPTDSFYVVVVIDSNIELILVDITQEAALKKFKLKAGGRKYQPDLEVGALLGQHGLLRTGMVRRGWASA